MRARDSISRILRTVKLNLNKSSQELPVTLASSSLELSKFSVSINYLQHTK